MKTTSLLPRQVRICLATAVLLGLTAGSAQAQSVYLGLGFLGLQGGYAHRINGNLGLRAELLGLPSAERTETDTSSTGVATEVKVKLNWSRISALADWHPSKSSGFRLSAGISSNNMGFETVAATAGGSVTINGKDYPIAGGDSFTLKVKMPSTTPYFGIGYGHHEAQKGLGFHADLGVLVGGFKLTESRTGALANNGSAGLTQADVDAELAETRQDLAKIKVLPQITLGLSYRF